MEINGVNSRGRRVTSHGVPSRCHSACTFRAVYRSVTFRRFSRHVVAYETLSAWPTREREPHASRVLVIARSTERPSTPELAGSRSCRFSCSRSSRVSPLLSTRADFDASTLSTASLPTLSLSLQNAFSCISLPRISISFIPAFSVLFLSYHCNSLSLSLSISHIPSLSFFLSIFLRILYDYAIEAIMEMSIVAVNGRNDYDFKRVADDRERLIVALKASVGSCLLLLGSTRFI